MQRPKLLHELLKGIISPVSYIISFDSVTTISAGVYRLNGICDFHHAQPGMSVTIGGNVYLILDYSDSGKTMTVQGTVAIVVSSFSLYKPFFFHGTPIQQQNELSKFPLSGKTPMIYLMEPYKTEYDYEATSSIDRQSDFTLCFLTQADISKWLTEDFYHKSISPMKNLFEDFMTVLIDSNLFHTVKQKAKPVFHTKFGINIQGSDDGKLYFAENLSGVSVDLSIEIYKDDSCGCGDGITFLSRDLGEFLQVS